MKDYSETAQPTITIVKAVANESFQIEMVDKVQRPGQRPNVLALLNKSDSRFNQGRNRFAWMKVMPAQLEEYFGVSATDLAKLEYEEGVQRTELVEGKHYITLDIEKPEIGGQPLHIEITETTEPTDWQAQNQENAVKQLEITEEIAANANLKKSDNIDQYIGEQGYFVTEEGEAIFSNAEIVAGEPEHTFLDSMLFASSEVNFGTKGVSFATPDEAKVEKEVEA